MTSFLRKMVFVQIGALAVLYLGGWALSLSQSRYWGYRDNFFTYRLDCLDGVAAWFLASLILMAINGIYVYRWASFEAHLSTPSWRSFQSGYGLRVPVSELKILAVNLVAIPALLTAFILVRQANL